MIIDALAAIGVFYLASKVAKVFMWYFVVNRNGNSGVGSGYHWSQER